MDTNATPLWDRIPSRPLTSREFAAALPEAFPGDYMAVYAAVPEDVDDLADYGLTFDEVFVESIGWHILRCDSKSAEDRGMYLVTEPPSEWRRAHRVTDETLDEADLTNDGVHGLLEYLDVRLGETIPSVMVSTDVMLVAELADAGATTERKYLERADGTMRRFTGGEAQADQKRAELHEERLKEAGEWSAASESVLADESRASEALERFENEQVEDDPTEHAQVTNYEAYEAAPSGETELTAEVAVPATADEVKGRVELRGAAVGDTTDMSEQVFEVGNPDPHIIGECVVEFWGPPEDVVRTFLATFPAKNLPDDLARLAGLEPEQVEQVAETEGAAANAEAAFERHEGGVVEFTGPSGGRETAAVERMNVNVENRVEQAVENVAEDLLDAAKGRAPRRSR